ncbi:MAG: SAM-dependent methyltransferase [Phycisphaerales bacterium]
MPDPSPNPNPTPTPSPTPRPVSRAGAKLAHALDAFRINPKGLGCADLGCSNGGFTQVLLQRGAAFVIAVDTAYGILDYTLRTDPRTIVMERTNALHAEPPANLPSPIELITIDLGWTTQRRCIPIALRWLQQARTPHIITLIKPHYEAKDLDMESALVDGALSDDDALSITHKVIAQLTDQLPIESLALTPSPIRGGKSAKRAGAEGNLEYLALLRPTDQP